MTAAIVYPIIAALFAFSAWLLGARFGWRLHRSDEAMRGQVDEAAVCSEADRAEQGIYTDWRLP